MYPATYNFRDELVGTAGTDIEFVTTNNFGTAIIIATLSNHNKILQLTSSGNYQSCYNNFTGQATGNIEFWIYFTEANKSRTIACLESGATRFGIRWHSDGKVYYYNGAWVDSGETYSDSVWYHYRFDFNAPGDTWDLYIDGTNIGTYGMNGAPSVIDRFSFGSSSDNGETTYLDAIGYSWDTDYAIGDNVHWRHYKESTDSFEGDDVGTQGTSITWVDGVDTAASVELVPEFGVHKKILRQDYTSGAGGFDYSYHTFASQATAGWWSGWISSNDVTHSTYLILDEDGNSIIKIGLITSKLQYWNNAAFLDAVDPAVNDTWYFVFIQWYADDTYDIWVNNVLIEAGVACDDNQVAGINRCTLRSTTNGTYLNLDAPMSSLDSDVRGNNRTFDYHTIYTITDITTEVINATLSNQIFQWRKGALYATEPYSKDDLFFRFYDINAKLAFEGEIKLDHYNGSYYSYTLRDKNQDALEDVETQTFTAAAIHDATDATCMTKTVLPNIAHANGRLLLVNADAEADTYSPSLRHYARFKFLHDLSDLADSVFIVKPDGKIDLDDDLASGDSLDIDTDGDYFLQEPNMIEIQEGITYFEIFGAINPEIGQRFYKTIDNTPEGEEPRKWRITNNNLLNQTDVDNYATAVSTKVVDIIQVRFKLQGLGAHNMGETFTMVYDTGNYIIDGTYYIIYEELNFDTAVSIIILSEGILESSEYSKAYEPNSEEVNAYASEIYNTDVVTIFPVIREGGGATVTALGQVQCNAINEGVLAYFYIDANIDPSRGITLTWVWERGDANNDVVDVNRTLGWETAAGAASGVVYNFEGHTLAACDNGEMQIDIWTIDPSDLTASSKWVAAIYNNEAGRDLLFECLSVKYYLKRVTS